MKHKKLLTNLHLTDSHGQSIFSASRVKLMETLAHRAFLTIRVPLIRPCTFVPTTGYMFIKNKMFLSPQLFVPIVPAIITTQFINIIWTNEIGIKKANCFHDHYIEYFKKTQSNKLPKNKSVVKLGVAKTTETLRHTLNL